MLSVIKKTYHACLNKKIENKNIELYNFAADTIILNKYSLMFAFWNGKLNFFFLRYYKTFDYFDWLYLIWQSHIARAIWCNFFWKGNCYFITQTKELFFWKGTLKIYCNYSSQKKNSQYLLQYCRSWEVNLVQLEVCLRKWLLLNDLFHVVFLFPMKTEEELNITTQFLLLFDFSLSVPKSSVCFVWLCLLSS